jgi:glutathione S-transferase
MIELYQLDYSTCSQKVRICLAEKDIEWVNRPVNTRANEHLTPEYLKLNPNGVVPTMVHDGQVILDSSVMCEYLDEVFPQKPLTPKDPVGRAHMRAWMRFLEEVPTAAIRVPSFHMSLAKRFNSLDEDQFHRDHADKRTIRKHFYHRMGTHGFSEREVSDSLEQLRMTLQRMEKALIDKPWLVGDDFTIADIIVIPTIDRMNDLGLSKMWEGSFPRVTDWYARVRKRPSFDKAYYPGSRISEVAALTITPLSEEILA